VLWCAVLFQEREAAQRAAELASRALSAEKRLVEAMKDEAAASAELLEAERAAKFAAQVRSRSHHQIIIKLFHFSICFVVMVWKTLS
jgi:hypothetical protein